MKWVKKDDCKTISDVIKRNIGTLDIDGIKHEIKGVDKLINVLLDAKNNNKKITIIGDYDVDGVCASGVMTQIMRYLNINFSVRLPRRMSEGFGLSIKIVNEINDSDIIITVDNGVAAIDAVKLAKEKGMYVVVTDHHLPNKDDNGNILYPDADIIIDPNAIPNSCDFTHFCGAGIAFKVAEKIITDEKILNICKAYATLATIADVVPLVNENHKIVKEGLLILNEQRDELNSGLKDLLKMAEIKDRFNEETIGYKLGPMLNAPGRLLDKGAVESLKLITSNNSIFTSKQAAFINEMNEKRKIKVLDAINLVKKQLTGKEIPSFLFLKQEDIEEGIIGIIAGKITEEFKKPCILLTNVEDGILKGSARTCGGIHLKNLLDDVNKSFDGNAFVKYGGHAEAAGLSLKAEMFDKIQKKIIELTPNIDTSDIDTVFYDLEIDANQIPLATAEIERYSPFGNTNEEIVFKINNFIIKPNKKGGLYTLFNENSGIRFQNEYASALSFDKANQYLENTSVEIDIIGTLRFNFFNNSISNQINIIDFKPSKSKKDIKEELKKKILGI